MKTKLSSGSASRVITFSSSKKKVASVTSSGKVTAKKKGKTTITVKTYNRKKAKLLVIVS
ncbi:MAG: Ig-like domain-containing protein [Clostridiaceae bacterium]|nr:Ig-like domain-containing protein [Clostridiaceae bacterium]